MRRMLAIAVVVAAIARADSPARPSVVPLRVSDDPERYRVGGRMTGARISARRAAERRFDRRTPAAAVQPGRCSHWLTERPGWKPCWIVVQADRYFGAPHRLPARIVSFVDARTGRFLGAEVPALACPCPANPV